MTTAFDRMLARANAAAMTMAGAETLTHHDGSVEGHSITGIFDEPGQRAAMFEGGPGVISTAPKLTVSDATAAGIDRGDALTRVKTGQTYYLVAPEPDGAGLTMLTLSEDEVE
jgi:hypothetical protein